MYKIMAFILKFCFLRMPVRHIAEIKCKRMESIDNLLAKMYNPVHKY